MKRAYVDIPDGQMHYRYSGNGDNHIIFLHMSGSSSDEYEKVGDILAEKGYHVYAIDLLGFGSSDRPSHFYSMQDHCRSIVNFMDAMNIDIAYFYGNMATANMAGHLGVDYSERVKGLILAHPLYNPDPEFFKAKRYLPAFAEIPLKDDGSHLVEMWKRSAKYGDAKEIIDQRCVCLHQAGSFGETLHWALHEDEPFCSFYKDINVKTVIVAYGFFGNPTLLNEVAFDLKNGSFDYYENATPYIARSNPKRVVDIVCKYFKE